MSVSGAGNTRTAFGLEMIAHAVYFIYITYIILYLKPDIAFAWTSKLVYVIVILIICYRYVKRGKWQERKI